jgi:CheY-like chemotaxis protein
MSEQDERTAPQLRILGVDDEIIVLRALRHLFTEQGIVFIGAGSADEALEIMGFGAEFDVIISDHRMSGMNGIDFLTEVRDLRPATLRILLTKQVADGELAEAFKTGAINFYMPKPWDDAQLLALVEAWSALNSRKPLQEPTPQEVPNSRHKRPKSQLTVSHTREL